MNHGLVTTYNRGCRCAACTEACRVRWHSYVKRVYLNRGPLMTDATGTRRRIQALSAIGWSMSDLARRLGVSVQALHSYTTAERTKPATRDAVRRLYAELSMTPGPSKYARTNAARHGWPPPLAWDDDTLDNPDAGVPCQSGIENVQDFYTAQRAQIDDVAVERFITGDAHWKTLTVPERIAAARLMHANCMSRKEIHGRCHINRQRLDAALDAQSASEGHVAAPAHTQHPHQMQETS